MIEFIFSLRLKIIMRGMELRLENDTTRHRDAMLC